MIQQAEQRRRDHDARANRHHDGHQVGSATGCLLHAGLVRPWTLCEQILCVVTAAVVSLVTWSISSSVRLLAGDFTSALCPYQFIVPIPIDRC